MLGGAWIKIVNWALISVSGVLPCGVPLAVNTYQSSKPQITSQGPVGLLLFVLSLSSFMTCRPFQDEMFLNWSAPSAVLCTLAAFSSNRHGGEERKEKSQGLGQRLGRKRKGLNGT